MIYQSPQNPNSHLTTKERKSLSYPTKYLLEQKLIYGRILDFGSGLGFDARFLQQQGFNITTYDPHYSPTYPQGKFDVILCHYVLNVLLPEEQAHVLMAISELLTPQGKAYFTVRRDIQYNGFRTHALHGVTVYQCNVVLPYKSILKRPHCEIYQYQILNQHPQNVTGSCPFCSPEKDREVVTESATVYAMLDKYPISPGHTLIIPKIHLADYFELSDKMKIACWLVTDRVKKILSQQFQPDGFNIGINVGKMAGQTIPHVHIHLIPRYTGDMENPAGGIRHIIPSKGYYFHPF